MPTRKITDVDVFDAIITQAIVCHIGLVDDKEPYVVPVCFDYVRNALYLHGNLKGRKAELTKKNNRVCFEMEVDLELKKAEEACDWAIKYMSVIGVGRARILEKEEDKMYALNLITKRYVGDELSFPSPKMDKTLVIKVDITSITGKQLV